MTSPSDISAVTNLIPTPNEGFTTTVAAPGVTSGGTTVPLAGVTGLTNGTIFVGIVEPGLTNQQTFTGTVDTAGVQITGVKWTRGTNAAHAAGVTIVDYVSGTGFKMLAKATSNHTDQDGTLSAGAVDVAAVLASNVVTTAKILDANVTTAKLADNAVTTVKITDANVTTAKIADSNVTTAKIADSAVTPAKMLGVDVFAYGGHLDGSPPTAGSGQFYMIADSAVLTLSGNNGNIAFPTAFPNGLLTVVATQGDSTGGFNAVTLTAETKTSFAVSIPAAGNAQVRINYIAIGF